MTDVTWFDVLFVFLGLVAFFIAIAPILHYSRFGHRERRQEVLEYFKDEHIEFYYDTFYPARIATDQRPEGAGFAQFYDQRFGWPSYRIPFVAYVLSLIGAFVWIIAAVLTDKIHGVEVRPAAYALAGAYLWIVFDLLSRFARRDIFPTRLYAYAIRLIIVIPLAYVVAHALTDAVRPYALVALGAFPTDTLFRIMRRQGAKMLQLSDEGPDNRYELELLEGVNKSKAERFSDAGVDSILELACQDPIQLTMRTNFAFRFIIDVMSQAVLYMYLPKLDVARRYAVRSSMDAAQMYEDFYERREGEERKEAQRRAQAVVDALAHDLKLPPVILLKIFNDARGDPANKFLTQLPF